MTVVLVLTRFGGTGGVASVVEVDAGLEEPGFSPTAVTER